MTKFKAISMFLAPMAASRIAIWTSLRTSQIANGFLMGAVLIPIIFFLLPTTHSVPRLASARLRPQDYWPMITRNSALREGLILRALLITSYVCYEIIARNFLLRSLMRGTTDSAEVLFTMGAALLAVQFVVLPMLQKRCSPKRLLQLSIAGLITSYLSINLVTSLEQFLVVTFLQTGCYAISYAESSTLITRYWKLVRNYNYKRILAPLRLVI
jgi:Na+/melibiose symporter-like transporter